MIFIFNLFLQQILPCVWWVICWVLNDRKVPYILTLQYSSYYMFIYVHHFYIYIMYVCVDTLFIYFICLYLTYSYWTWTLMLFLSAIKLFSGKNRLQFLFLFYVFRVQVFFRSVTPQSILNKIFICIIKIIFYFEGNIFP